MATVLLPFHQDERVGPDSIELPSPAGYQTVEPRLPDGDQWTRLVQLYDVLGSDVAASVTAGEATTVGGAAAEAITVTGLATTDLVFVTIKTTGATPRTIVKATPTLNTLTVTFSDDPSNDHVVHYMALRAAT